MIDDTDLDREMAEFEQQSKAALAKESSAPTAEQGTPAWLQERVGHCTASRFRDVMDFTKGGKPSAKREAYKLELVIERITGQPTEHFVSKPMMDGIEREPMAKMAYERRTGAMLQSSGFRHHKTIKWVGGSPDALLDGGGLECKCPTPPTHIKTILDGMDDEHMPQVQGLIWLFDEKWWDFESFCPIFDEPLRTYIQRIPRNDDYLAELVANIGIFLGEVDALHKAVIAKQRAA